MSEPIPTFSARQFEYLAGFVRASGLQPSTRVAEMLADYLYPTNPRFDRDKFIAAAEYQITYSMTPFLDELAERMDSNGE